MNSAWPHTVIQNLACPHSCYVTSRYIFIAFFIIILQFFQNLYSHLSCRSSLGIVAPSINEILTERKLMKMRMLLWLGGIKVHLLEGAVYIGAVLHILSADSLVSRSSFSQMSKKRKINPLRSLLPTLPVNGFSKRSHIRGFVL